MTSNVSNRRLDRCFTKSLKCKSRQTRESFFFPQEFLMFHVLFKLPSAGTPISKSPWRQILLSTSQPFIHQLVISPFTHGGQRGNTGKEICKGRLFLRKYIKTWGFLAEDRQKWQSSKERMLSQANEWRLVMGRLKKKLRWVKGKDCGREAVWPCVRLMSLKRKRIAELLTHTNTHSYHTHPHEFTAVGIATLSLCWLIHYPPLSSSLAFCLYLIVSGRFPPST